MLDELCLRTVPSVRRSDTGRSDLMISTKTASPRKTKNPRKPKAAGISCGLTYGVYSPVVDTPYCA